MSTTLLLLLGAGLFLALGRKNRRAEQIGRIKRRIYKEVSLAQSAGVDFSKNFDDLTDDEIVVLESVGSDAGWKQSKRSIEAGKSYAESYYGSLRRAWNAVSGVQGIGRAYNVKDADGNLVLTWIEDAAAHVARERELEEMEKKIRQTRNRMKRRQREIDRRGFLPQPAQTPAEVKVEESAEVIEQPDAEPVAPPTPKKNRVSRKELKEQEYAARKEFAENFLTELENKPWAKNRLYRTSTKHGKTYKQLVIDAFAAGILALKHNCEVQVLSPTGKKEWLNFQADLTFYDIAELILNGWKKHGIDSPETDELRKALLERAKHMDVYISTDGEKNVYDPGSLSKSRRVDNIITARGDDRFNHIDKINYVVIYSGDMGGGVRVYYPVRAFADELEALSFANWKGNKYKVVPITQVKIDAISGVSGWRDIEELCEDIYDAVQDFINYPDGYERPVLHVYISDGERVAEVDDNLPISESDGVYDIYSLIRDGEPDIDAISDIANSWVFLD